MNNLLSPRELKPFYMDKRYSPKNATNVLSYMKEEEDEPIERMY